MVTVNDAYEILNLTPGASQDKVIENYRALALKWHPDKNKQSSESFEKFRKLCSAFRRIVSNDQLANDLTMEQMFEIFQDAFLFYKRNGCKSFNSSSEDEDDDDIVRDDDDEEESDLEMKQGNGLTCDVSKMIVVRKGKGTLMPVSSEIAKKNAEELLAEEEKERRKAEKRRAKKKRRRQKKKLEKELGQEKGKESKSQSDSQNKDKTNASSSEESESEEEWDPNSAFVATVANKSKVSNHMQNSKPDKVFTDESKDTSKEMDIMGDDNDPTILKSRKLAIRANEIASLGNFEAAIELFTEAIKMNPKDFRFYGNRSYCYEKIKLYDRALKDAEKAISLNSNWPKNYYRKGRALAGLMRFTEAEKAFEKVLSLDKACKDAEQELLNIRVDKMMEMGFTRQQAYLGIQQYESVEKAVEAMSHFKGVVNNAAGNERDVFISDDEGSNIPSWQKNLSPPVTDVKMDPNNPEGLCTLWIGNVSKDVTEKMLRLLFGQYGTITSLRIIPDKFCAFINYESKDSASKAMKALQGTVCEGQRLLIKFPDNPPAVNLTTAVNKKIINTNGAVTNQNKQTGPVNNNECYFWRTTGCSYGDNCRYKHVKEHKGIDRKGWHKM